MVRFVHDCSGFSIDSASNSLFLIACDFDGTQTLYLICYFDKIKFIGFCLSINQLGGFKVKPQQVFFGWMLRADRKAIRLVLLPVFEHESFLANLPANSTAQKTRFWVPSALRLPFTLVVGQYLSSQMSKHENHSLIWSSQIMKYFFFLILVFLTTISFAQTDRPKIKLSGETFAVGHSHFMILTATFRHFREKNPSCSYLTSAHREVIEKSPDLERGENGDVLRGYVREKWTFEACGVTDIREIQLRGAQNGTIWSTGPWIDQGTMPNPSLQGTGKNPTAPEIGD